MDWSPHWKWEWEGQRWVDSGLFLIEKWADYARLFLSSNILWFKVINSMAQMISAMFKWNGERKGFVFFFFSLSILGKGLVDGSIQKCRVTHESEQAL